MNTYIIPLGGNHVTISRNIVNLLIVWMLTGMWHGAAWNFIVWGIYYGVVLVLEKYVWGAIVDRWPSVLQHIYCISTGAWLAGCFSLVQVLEQHFVTSLQWLAAEQDLPVKKYSL